ncbi:MAG: DUF559 domain-containing protein [Pseudomonadota bacterium]
MPDQTLRSKPPVKALRRDAAETERRLWTRLRRRQVSDAKFRRQHTIDGYVADFACIALKTVVEIDGASHATAEEQAHDAQRTEWFESLGWQVIRVTQEDVLNQIDDVVDFIARSLPSSPVSEPDSPQTDETNDPWLTKD